MSMITSMINATNTTANIIHMMTHCQESNFVCHSASKKHDIYALLDLIGQSTWPILYYCTKICLDQMYDLIHVTTPGLGVVFATRGVVAVPWIHSKFAIAVHLSWDPPNAIELNEQRLRFEHFSTNKAFNADSLSSEHGRVSPQALSATTLVMSTHMLLRLLHCRERVLPTQPNGFLMPYDKLKAKKHGRQSEMLQPLSQLDSIEIYTGMCCMQAEGKFSHPAAGTK